ncbi:hypothetical protein GGS20DRAFT_445122 [Poronia punctata]|nr:hypothetical protein GGS20DRAFT_445122 [Poronia punctata]
MQQHIISYLSVLLMIQPFMGSVMASWGPHHVMDSNSDLVSRDELNPAVSDAVETVTEVSTVVTTVNTATVFVTIQPTVDTIDGHTTEIRSSETYSSETRTGDSPLTNSIATIPTGASTITGSETAGISIASAGTDSIEPFGMTAVTILSPWISPTSTLSSVSGSSTGMDTTFTTITTPAPNPALSPTSVFDTALCDDIYCNSEGNEVCMYWAGMTSWDVSDGAMPGEVPTIIGTC